MLKFSKISFHPRQHIIPPHAKYVVISAIIIFAIFSSHIPAFSILYAKSNYRDSKKVASSKKLQTIVVTKTPIRKTDGSKVSKTSNTSYIASNVTPAPTKNYQADNKITQVPRQEIKVAVTNTSAPTAAPTQEPQAPSSSVPGDAKGQLLSALNAYRQKKGKSSLSWDDTLAEFAQGRAEQFDREGKMDNHAGFHDLVNNDGFNRMGFMSLAENSSFGDTRDPVFIIETLYGQSSGHDANQLNGEYTHVGIGASGKATDFLFGGKKK